MANVMTTEIRVYSTPKTIEWLENELKAITDIKDSEERNLKLIDKFGKDAEEIIDRVGAKWITIDSHAIYNKNEEEIYFKVESANWIPDAFLMNLYDIVDKKEREIEEIEEDDYSWVNVDGRYWDEAFQPIGKFSASSDEVQTDEASLDEIDYDDEDYWDNQVEPEFDKLEV